MEIGLPPSSEGTDLLVFKVAGHWVLTFLYSKNTVGNHDPVRAPRSGKPFGVSGGHAGGSGKDGRYHPRKIVKGGVWSIVGISPTAARPVDFRHPSVGPEL